MEGRVAEFLYTEPVYRHPYMNHYGYGNSIGCGDALGCGRAFIEPRKEDNYNGSGIISFNGNKTYFIDGYTLYVTHIHEPWAMGEIVGNDCTTYPCYLAKINNKIVVASSLHDVLESMREKIFNTVDNDDDIARAFVLSHPDYTKEYDWDEMVAWHSLSRTSCADGRRRFSQHAHKNHGDKATPKELIEFMKNSPSRPIAEKMENIYLCK